MHEGMKVTPTYDRHTAQRGNERRRGKAIGGKVPQLADAHEDHAEPPHRGGVVGFGGWLRLTEMSVFLPGGFRRGGGLIHVEVLLDVSRTISLLRTPHYKTRATENASSEQGERNLMLEPPRSPNYIKISRVFKKKNTTGSKFAPFSEHPNDKRAGQSVLFPAVNLVQMCVCVCVWGLITHLYVEGNADEDVPTDGDYDSQQIHLQKQETAHRSDQRLPVHGQRLQTLHVCPRWAPLQLPQLRPFRWRNKRRIGFALTLAFHAQAWTKGTDPLVPKHKPSPLCLTFPTSPDTLRKGWRDPGRAL